MTFARFHNALRIMLNLDGHELELSRADWLRYTQDPFRFFIRAPTPEAERIWALIEARQKPSVPDTPSDRHPVTPESLDAWADKIDNRLGPISGRDSDLLAVVLREAAIRIRAMADGASADLSMMLRRFIFQAEKAEGDNSLKVLAGNARQLLAKYGLQGNVLRARQGGDSAEEDGLRERFDLMHKPAEH